VGGWGNGLDRCWVGSGKAVEERRGDSGLLAHAWNLSVSSIGNFGVAGPCCFSAFYSFAHKNLENTPFFKNKLDLEKS